MFVKLLEKYRLVGHSSQRMACGGRVCLYEDANSR